MKRTRKPYTGTPLVGVVLLFSAIFRAMIFWAFISSPSWVLAIIGIEAVALVALAAGAIRRTAWAKSLAIVYIVGSTFALLAIWFYSTVSNLALLDVFINLLLIWYVGAPDAEQRRS